MARVSALILLPLRLQFLSRRILFEWTLLEIGVIRIRVPLIFDIYSYSFALSVFLIASAVIIFSSSYISHEKFFSRFHLLVFSFVARIILLIFSPNLISLLIGWDGLGVTSYLLVIYFFSHKSLNAGLLTALTNRVGDCLFLLSIAIFRRITPISLFILSPASLKVSILPAIILIIAVSTKRAQLPFSAWLPAAIAAPTPVSSLVHSSTLVTAGVYVLFRLSESIPRAPIRIIMLIGCLTITLARLAALTEIDIKKIVALSTLRQLGLIITIMGAGRAGLSFFHLLSHAYFKALLFIRVGNLIHLSAGIQDLRLLFTGKKRALLTPSVAILANLSLIGTPFMAGFYSKDSILENRLLGSYSIFFMALLLISVAFTAAYRARFMALASWKRDPKLPTFSVEDNDNIIFYSIRVLTPFAIFGGSLLTWTIFRAPQIPIIASSFKALVLLIIVAGAILGVYSPQHLLKRKLWWWAIRSMWALPFLSGKTNKNFLVLRSTSYSRVDIKWLIFSMLSLFGRLFSLAIKSFVGIASIIEIAFLLMILIFVLLIY